MKNTKLFYKIKAYKNFWNKEWQKKSIDEFYKLPNSTALLLRKALTKFELDR